MASTAEQLFRALLRGPLRVLTVSKANQWAGRVTIASGQETATVSTTVVGSDDIVHVNMQRVDTVGSLGQAVCVRTISPGNFVQFGTTDSQAVPADTIVMWQIVKPG